MIAELSIVGGLFAVGLTGTLTMAWRAISAERRTSAVIVEREDLRREKDVLSINLTQVTGALSDETKRRIALEDQLTQARSKYSALLRRHMEKATDEEIRDLTAAAFADFGVPSVPRAQDPVDGLIDPETDMPPT